jgi:hypothetical protein
MGVEMTREKVKKHALDFSVTLPYFFNHIGCGKILSQRICKYTDFSHGSFFTILPPNALVDRLFSFENGGIIPPVPYSISKDHPSAFHAKKIITMDWECSEFFSRFFKKSDTNLAVVENYILEPNSPYVGIENVKMIPFHSDVYYFLNKNNSVHDIYKTIRKSSQVWHFLAVLTELKKGIPSLVTDGVIQEICENTRMIVAGAYDGEGYIFWEKKIA